MTLSNDWWFNVILILAALCLGYLVWQFRDVAFRGKPLRGVVSDPKTWAAIAGLVLAFIAILIVSYAEVRS